MKNKKLIIMIGICGVIALSGCAKSPAPETETPAVESSGENEQADREGVNALPTILGEGIEKIETTFPDENQSYIVYEGIDLAMRNNFKESIAELGFTDWMSMESEDEGLVYDTAMTEDTQITMIYPMDDELKSLQVYMIENIDELIEQEETPEDAEEEVIEEDIIED